jgi:hypothetical protein
MRRAVSARSFITHERCRCGKAIYDNDAEAGRDRKRYDLARIYRCEFGERHLTSSEDRPVKRGKNTVEYRRRHTVHATCPLRPRDLAGHLGDTCPHPLHWSDRDPARPYFPDVDVDLRRFRGLDPYLVMGVVSSALTRDGDAVRAVVNGFRGEFRRAGDDGDAALRVIMTWVAVEDGGDQ